MCYAYSLAIEWVGPQQPPPPARKSYAGLIIGIVVAAVVLCGGAAAAVVVVVSHPKSGPDCLVGTWRSTSATDIVSTGPNSDGDKAALVSGSETLVYRSDGVGGYHDADLKFSSTTGGDEYVITADVTYRYTVSHGVVTYESVAGTATITTGGDATTQQITSLDPSTYSCSGDVLTESQTDPQSSYSARYVRQ